MVISIFNFAQATKVAILDFENTSGKPEYDALAKAISSMLITDLANNIHPKKVEFFERSQLNKLLDEQKLQKSKDFDTKTAVDFGKLSGVNYVFVGSVFVMDKTCNFSSKLVDVQTSKIILSKDVSGNIVNFLQLKSQLAEAIAIQLNNPITLDPSYKDQSTTLSTINQYGKILNTMDQGDAEKAEQIRSLFEETNPDFKYYQEIKDDIEELKKQVEKNTADIKVLNQSGDLVINAKTYVELNNNLQSVLIEAKDKFNNEMLVQLNDFLSKRRRNVEKIYNALPNDYFEIIGTFSGIDINKYQRHSWMHIPIRIKHTNPKESRLRVVKFLEDSGVETRPPLTGNFLRQPAMKKFRNLIECEDNYRIADEITDNTFLIGCHHDLSDNQIEYLSDKLIESVKYLLQ